MLGHNRNNRQWWHKKRLMIPLVLLLTIIGVSFVLEGILLKQANKIAATVNPEFKGHIADLDLSLLKGAVVLSGVTGTLKKNDRKFLEVDTVEADLAWRELFKGSLLFDVVVNSFDVKFKKDILAAAKRLPQSEKKEMKQSFKLAHLDIIDSKVTIMDLPGLNKDKHLTVKNIHGQVTDLTQRKNTELAKYDMNATLTGKDTIKLTGNLDMAADPLRFDLNAKFRKFELNSMNEALRAQFPLNYKNGTLDIYSEVKSEGGKMYGYVKPFLNDVEYIGNNNEFKGAKHFFVEVVGTFANWMFERDKPDTVATRIPFIYEDGTFSVESGEAISEAIEHGLVEGDKLDRGIENKYRLNRSNPDEVQAQEAPLQMAKDKKVEKAKEAKEEEKEKAEEKAERKKEKEEERKEEEKDK